MSNKKTMKKSMVVTTVVMVLLLIAALSTATFAWYTAQNNASVTETLVTSASSNSASLVIDTAAATSNTANNASVDLTMTSATAAINPAVYNGGAAPTVGTTTYTDFAGKFITYTVDSKGNYASAPGTTSVATIATVKGSGSEETKSSFFITNVGGIATGIDAAVTINANYYEKQTVTAGDPVDGLYTKDSNGVYTATAAGDAADGSTDYYALKANNFLRVAMFIDGKYAGTWALSDQKAVQIANVDLTSALPAVGTTPDAHTSYDATVSGTTVNIAPSVASMGSIEVQLVAWFEGDSHTNAYAGTGALFSVSFTGVTAVSA